MLIVIPLVKPDPSCSIPELSDAMDRAFQKFSPGANHNLLIVASPSARPSAEVLFNKLQKYFANSATEVLVNNHDLGWPRENNFYFQQAAYLVSKYAKPTQGWLWMDLSCVPVTQNWATLLEQEYYLDIQTAHIEGRQPHRFMGTKEETFKSSYGEKTPDGYHMAGCGVYPGDFYNCPVLKSIHSVSHHFSVHLKWYPIKSLNITSSIQNNRDTANYRVEGEQIVCDSKANNAFEQHWNNPVSSKAVLVTGCLDGSLVNVVAGERIAERPVPSVVAPVKVEPPKPATSIHPSLNPPQAVMKLSDLQRGGNKPAVEFDEKTGLAISPKTEAPVVHPVVEPPPVESPAPKPTAKRAKKTRSNSAWTPERRARQAELARERFGHKKPEPEPIPA